MFGHPVKKEGAIFHFGKQKIVVLVLAIFFFYIDANMLTAAKFTFSFEKKCAAAEYFGIY